MDEVCEFIAGGFVEESVQCVVAIEICKADKKDTNNNTLLYSVISKSPKQDPGDIISSIAKLLGRDIVDLTVSVFAICGGIDGSKFKFDPNVKIQT